MARVSNGNVLISLPHFGPKFQFFLKLPFVPELKCTLKIPFPKRHAFDGQHYWEIGMKEYGVRKIRQHIEKYFKIEREFVPFHNQYQHFYILKKKHR